ncbi:hypothetical protein [Bdellovibrio bacteriovorus]|uniref:hypothetical protein n=1 Tax=Bdellovibrio bacteriovorus TaxID=959 RepID=UPI0035A72F55
MKLVNYLVTIFLLIYSDAAFALGAGVAGKIEFENKNLSYYNGTSWFTIDSSIGASCSGYAAGTIHFDSPQMRFCDGTDWRIIVSTPVSTCTPTSAGALEFNTPNLRFCDGTDWRRIEATALTASPSLYSSPVPSIEALHDASALTGVGTSSGTEPWIEVAYTQPKTTSSATFRQLDLAAPGTWGAHYLNGASYQYHDGAGWVTLANLSGFTNAGAAITFSHGSVTATRFRVIRLGVTNYLGVGEFVINP